MGKVIKINVSDTVKAKEALKLHSKTEEKVRNRNKPVKEVEQYVDDGRSQIITKERTEKDTSVYHEGKYLKNGKWIIHPRHLKSYKKQLVVA